MKKDTTQNSPAKARQRENTISVTQLPDGTFPFHGRSHSITADKKNKALAPYGKMVWEHGLQLVLLPTPEQMTSIRKVISSQKKGDPYAKTDYHCQT